MPRYNNTRDSTMRSALRCLVRQREDHQNRYLTSAADEHWSLQTHGERERMRFRKNMQKQNIISVLPVIRNHGVRKDTPKTFKSLTFKIIHWASVRKGGRKRE